MALAFLVSVGGRQVAAGERVTDAQGQPMGQSEPRVLVPLDELHFDGTDAPEPAG